MRKLLLGVVLALAFWAPAWAQVGNTPTIRFAGAPTGTAAPLSFAINNATGDLYDSVGGAWVKIGSGGSGGGTPAGATGTVQTNAGGGAFGAVTGLIGGSASCESGDPCYLNFTNTNGDFIMEGANSAGSVGNFFMMN